MPSLAELKGHLNRSPVGYRRDRFPAVVQEEVINMICADVLHNSEKLEAFQGSLRKSFNYANHTLNFTFRKLSLNHLLNVKERIQE